MPDYVSTLRVLVTADGVARANAGLMSVERTGSKVAAGMKVAMAAAGIAVAAGVKEAVSAAAGFEQQMSKLGAVTDANAKQMKRLEKAAISAGAKTKFSAREAAAAQVELAKGGLSVRDIMKGGLNGALALAAAGEMDLAEAASSTVNALNLFKLKGRDAGHVADVLATAANATTADVADFAMALTQGGSAAKAVGMTLDQTVVTLEALAAAGVKNSDAGTSMKAMITQLAAPTAKAQELMGKLNLRFFDSKGRFKDVSDVSRMLRDRLGGLTKQQQLAAATTLAGTDGQRALLAVMRAGPKTLDKYAGGLKKQGTAARVAAKMQDNLAGKWEQFTGSLETLAIKVGSKALPALSAITDKATEVVNALASIDIGKVFGGTGGARQALGGISTWVRQVVDDSRGSLQSIGDTAQEIAGKFQQAFGQVGEILKSTFGAGTGFADDVRKIVDAVIWLGAQVGKVFGGALGRYIAGFVQQFRGLAQTVRGVVKVIAGILTLDFGKAWDGVKDIFGGALNSIVGSMRTATAPIREVAQRLGTVILRALNAAWDAIKGAARSAWSAVTNTVESAVGGVKSAASAVGQGALGAIRSAWSALKGVAGRAFQALVEAIRAKIRGASQAAADVATTVWNAVKSLPGEFVELGKHIVQGLIDGMESKGGDLLKIATKIAHVATDPTALYNEIKSPSRLMYRYGRWVVEGLANGISDAQALAERASSKLAKAVSQSFNAASKLNAKNALFPLEARLARLQAQAEKLQGSLSSAKGGGGSLSAAGGAVRAAANGTLAVIAGGKYLQGMGLQVAESKYFGGVTTSRHAHYLNDHYSGNSIDINYAGGGAAEKAKLDAALAKLKAKFGDLVDAFVEDAGTANQHLHATFKNVKVAAQQAVKIVGGGAGKSGVNNTAFAKALLAALGVKVSSGNVRNVLGWIAAEGTSAKFNPLATTQAARGATSFNSVGVKNYTSAQQGLQATVKTLRNGFYGPILDALRRGASPDQFAAAVGSTPWGTGGGFASAIRAAKIGSDGGSIMDGYAKGAQALLKVNERQQRAIEQAIAFRDAIGQVRSQISDKLTAAVDKFKAKWEATVGAAFDAQTQQMIASGPYAKALAELQAQDEQIRRAAEDAANQQALNDALASGDQAAISQAQAAIEQTARDREITRLTQLAADEQRQIEDQRAEERAKLKQQDVEDFKTAEKSKLDALVRSLKSQEITYATFVKRVRSMLSSIGLNFPASPELEAALAQGEGTAKKGSGAAKKAGGYAFGNYVKAWGGSLPSFDGGGLVPGTVGSPQPILAHGGEMVLTPEQAAALGVPGLTGAGVVVVFQEHGDRVYNTEFDIEKDRRATTFKLQNALRGR